MQSGFKNNKKWILEFVELDQRFHDQVMGWVGSGNMYRNEVMLYFTTKEQAIEFATKNSIEYFIREPNKYEYQLKSYISKYF
ncbi:MAG: glutaredoxin 2 [Candidatus Midichloriaceae bacterium]|jgi:glutaredoxin 2